MDDKVILISSHDTFKNSYKFIRTNLYSFKADKIKVVYEVQNCYKKLNIYLFGNSQWNLMFDIDEIVNDYEFERGVSYSSNINDLEQESLKYIKKAVMKVISVL